MDKALHKEIIKILESVDLFLAENNIAAIRNWSDKLIDSITIYQDRDTIRVATMVYALSSILGREDASVKRFREMAHVNIQKAIVNLKSKKIEEFRSQIIDILRGIMKLDAQFSEHVGTILRKAKIVKGSQMYEHGISPGRAAEILGITKWELMRKIGGMDEPNIETRDVKSRYNFAKKIFGE